LARITNPLETSATAEVTLERGGEIIAERNPVVEPGSESIILSGIDTPQGSLEISETMSVRGPRRDVGGSPTIDPGDSSTPAPESPMPDGDGELPEFPSIGRPVVVLGAVLLGVLAIW
jgi:hypothetical protein